MAGAEYGVRGFIDAYDAQTGKRSWRFFTTAGPEDPGHTTWRGMDAKAWEKGGGSTWATGAYDPELNLVYWGTGNAGPDYDGSAREGDNLYTASIVALDADTGRLRWHYQFHAARCVGLGFDPESRAGRPDDRRSGAKGRDVRQPQWLFLSPRPGDREIDQGEAIHRDDLGERDSTRRPSHVPPEHHPSEDGTRVCPDQSGGTNWMPPSFDKSLGLLFLTARESCGIFFTWKTTSTPATAFGRGAVQR
jgi:alcohol dehydrogenase (cytochrome c)